jgi:hypothetical protein
VWGSDSVDEGNTPKAFCIVRVALCSLIWDRSFPIVGSKVKIQIEESNGVLGGGGGEGLQGLVAELGNFLGGEGEVGRFTALAAVRGGCDVGGVVSNMKLVMGSWVAVAASPPHTPTPLHVQAQLDPHPSKAIS